MEIETHTMHRNPFDLNEEQFFEMPNWERLNNLLIFFSVYLCGLSTVDILGRNNGNKWN